MANYSAQQIEQLWIKNGGSPEWAPTMAAVAIAESGGNPTIPNAQGSGAMGLWQILSSAQSAAFNAQHPAATMTDPDANAKAAIALLGDGSGITNWETDVVADKVIKGGGKPLTSAEASEAVAALGQSADLTSDVTTAATDTSNAAGSTGQPSVDTAMVPTTTFAAPIAGADVKNFHGYDLSAIPTNELGNAEQAIQKYITDPGYASQLQARVSEDYGYSGSWAEKIPELNSVLIWAATSLDLSTAAGKDQFQTAVWNTTWWKTTDANKRSWEQIQGTDPAQAAEAYGDAEGKVLGDANQMGVKLTASELNQIATVYAEQTFEQSGALGSQSGVAAEWLDQAITNTILNVKNQAVAGLATDYSSTPNESTFDQQTAKGSSPDSLFGIASQLYSQFQTQAQDYLMYNPNGGGLLTNKDLLGYVDNALKNYTGTGSSFGSSNLIEGAVTQFTQQMMQQASKIYPSLAEAIKAGTTPSQYTTPYANAIGETLGIDPDSINFTSPKWNWVIATPNPAKGNQKEALTLDQVQQKIVTDPSFGYQNTNGAKTTALSVTSALANAFGFGGG